MTTEAFAYLLADMELNAEKRAAVLAYVERQAAEIARLRRFHSERGKLLDEANVLIAALVHDNEKYADRDTQRLAELERLRAAAAVPREPTQAMIESVHALGFYADYSPLWRAMYDAAPAAAPAPAPMTDAEVDAAINDTFPGDATITHTTWDWLRAIFRAGRASK